MAVSKETQNKTTGSVGGNAQEQQNFTQSNQAAGQAQAPMPRPSRYSTAVSWLHCIVPWVVAWVAKF